VKHLKFIILITTILSSTNAMAYRQPLHVMMTKFAGTQSALGGTDLWHDWNRTPTEKFLYQKMQVHKDNVDGHKTSGVIETSIYLLGYGADAEDENDDTPLPNRRAFSHFFNPQNNTKLDLSWLFTVENYTSPDWALEGVSTSSSQKNIAMQNFSYSDAQFYFYQAFSGTFENQRSLGFGKMFQTLGNVMHHVEDMAQPEHTRLDMHCDATFCDFTINAIEDDKSVYEELTDSMVSCSAFTTNIIENGKSVPCEGLRSWEGPWNTTKIYLGGYPIPANFANGLASIPRDFWTTSDLKGMADFSSRNFISTDTAYKFKSYTAGAKLLDVLLPARADLPFPSGSKTETYENTVLLSTLLPNIASTSLANFKDYKMTFIGIHAKDNQLPSPQMNVDISRMATYSVFSERLAHTFTKAGVSNSFTVNNFNLEERAKILVPRAVGYSTGLLNYFFRYRLKVTEAPVNGQRSRWSVQNLSNYDFSGCLEFYYDVSTASDNVRTKVDSCRSVFIRAGGTITTDALVVDASKNPLSTFYAIALESTGDSSRPWVAVAATSFQNSNKIPELCKSSSSYTYNGYPQSTKNSNGTTTWFTPVNTIKLADGKGRVTINLSSIDSRSSLYELVVAKTTSGNPGINGMLNFNPFNNALSIINLPSGAQLLSAFEFPSSNISPRSYTFEYDPDTFPNKEVMIWTQYTRNDYIGLKLSATVSCPAF